MIKVLEPSDLKIGDILITYGAHMVEVVALGTKHVIAQEVGLFIPRAKEIVLTQNDLVDYEIKGE